VSVPDPAPTALPPERRRRSLRADVRRAGPFVAGIAAAFVGITLWTALNPPPRPLTSSDVRNAVASALASQTPAPAHGEAVYAIIQPSLVVIETDDAGTATTKPGHGIGSGVIVSDSGTVLTALHVVAGAQRIQLTFADGSKSDAIVANEDPSKDIAVVQPVQVPAQFTPATLGNPAGLRIGSEAYVVGTPFGLAGSLSSGVVSALDRSFVQPTTNQTMTGLIQVDAAINPGNSGGPLLDRNGRVVGIVTALINPTNDDVFIGIGLAVPITVAGGAAGLPPA
jgi:S1-C subfamily serine protease